MLAIIAAILLLLLCAFHSLLGERVILRPLKKRTDLPKIWGSQRATFRTIQATWHLVSALWFGLALLLILTQFFPLSFELIFFSVFGVIFGLLTIVPLVWESGKHKSWIAFGLLSGLLLALAYQHYSAAFSG